jgi:Holliday junction DNA helicase RuvA
MYSFIRGTLVQMAASYAVIETHGVGYKVHVPIHSPLSLGKEVLLHTSFVVREFSQSLYGFLQEEERDLFETLLEISGIGPKIALNLIGHMTYSGLYEAVFKKDLQSFIKVPGIGKKTAERLLVELKDKLDLKKQEFSIPASLHSKQQAIQDAIKALMNLGYNSAAAQKAIKKTLEHSEELDLPALISTALKHV